MDALFGENFLCKYGRQGVFLVRFSPVLQGNYARASSVLLVVLLLVSLSSGMWMFALHVGMGYLALVKRVSESCPFTLH